MKSVSSMICGLRKLYFEAFNSNQCCFISAMMTAEYSATMSVKLDQNERFVLCRSMQSSFFPGPILGCKCQMCTTFFRSSGLLGFACTPYVTDSSGKNPVLRDMRKLVSLQK